MTATAALLVLTFPLAALAEPPAAAPHEPPPAVAAESTAEPARPPRAGAVPRDAGPAARPPGPQAASKPAPRPIVPEDDTASPDGDDSALGLLERAMGEAAATPGDGGADESAPAPPVEPLTPAQHARQTASAFLAQLIRGNVRGLLAVSGLPFMLEGRRIERPAELAAEWTRLLSQRRTDLFTLYDVEVLEPAEMRRRHGAPPARLSGWALDAPGMLIAVGNLSGHPVVLLVRPIGSRWGVVGFHD